MLQNVARKSCSFTLPSFDWHGILQSLAGEGKTGVIFGTKTSLLERFGLTAENVGPEVLYPNGNVFGELFFPNDQATVYVKITGRYGSAGSSVTDDNVWEDPGKEVRSGAYSGKCEIGAIQPVGEDETGVLEDFAEAVERALAAQGAASKQQTWDEPAEAAGSAASPFDGEPAAAPDARSLELASIFREGKLDAFFDALGENGHSINLDGFLEKTENRDETEYYIDKLFEADFLTDEIVVSCRKTGAPTIRARDRAGLAMLADQGITCSCGAPIQDENVQRLVILPEANRSYISKTWTAKIQLLNLLLKMGFDAAAVKMKAASDKLELAFVPVGDRGFVFGLTGGSFDQKAGGELAKAVGKGASVRVAVFGAKGVDAQAVKELEGKFGKDGFLALGGLDDFNTKLLGALNAERMAVVLSTLDEFRDLLNVDLSSLVLSRLS
ncbi:MAG: hypothetical protein M5R36_22945 [Deltaproteobacteria bacterium]|nr:hypothetical protein [Deltaproteobacteria bacterium]